MKVAFATDDRKTISKYTGKAIEFAVYELSAFEVISVEYFENNHEHSDEQHGHSHEDIIEKIKDVDYFYVKLLGKHLKKDVEEAQIQYEFTDEDMIDSVIQDFFEEESA